MNSRTTKVIRIMLVDDHHVVRIGLGSSLGLEEDMKIVAEDENISQLMSQYETHQPDLVVLDWRLPDGNGLDAIQQLRQQHPNAKILVVSAFDSEEIIFQAIQAGALGYIAKSSRRSEIIDAVRKASAGDNAFSPEIAIKLAARIKRPELTQREIEIIKQLVRGNSNKEIASNLSISGNTVKAHLMHIMQKMHAKDRTHVASIALQRGLVDG
jgi:DNA-binding NarL/FixJ family response regulator